MTTEALQQLIAEEFELTEMEFTWLI